MNIDNESIYAEKAGIEKITQTKQSESKPYKEEEVS